jgi:LmbE family N-acetylglucosaminyl deacetylase
MSTYYDAIYLSPHLDDVALSCGGQIYQRTAAGERVLIVSITAGDPPHDAVSSYAQSLHDRWALVSDAVAARRAEDIAACRILGADWLHWDLPDCIYRFHPETGAPFYVSDPDIFGAVHAAEQPIVAQLRDQIAALPAHGLLVAPLTIGNHVDHTLTRLAAEATADPTLWYYEDYPYAQQAEARRRGLPPVEAGWTATTIALSEAALTAKIAAIGAFKSQLSTFFHDDADLARQVRTFTEWVGGEQLWRYAGQS